MLKPTKNHAIIDFISYIPEMRTKAVTRDNSIHRNEMIYTTMFWYSDFKKILATCRLDPAEDEYKICVDSFPYIFKLYQEKRYVDDEVFE